VESALYDPNDLGILSAPNEITYRAGISYQQFKPTKDFITYSYSLNARLQYQYKPYAFNRTDFTGTAFWVFRNFWDVTLSTILSPGETHDYFELRTDGWYLAYPFNYIFTLNGSSDSRKKFFFRYGGAFARSPDYDNNYYGVDIGFRYRFNNKFSVDLQTDSRMETNQLGYAFVREMNGDPIVGFRDNKEFVSVFTSTYNFTPRLNLSFRARHYWNKVDYQGFYNVDSKGHLVPRAFINGMAQNVNIFNLDAFLTWDFRLGSRVVLGYKNWLGNDELVTINTGKNTYLRNLGQVFDLRHGNEITLRVIYYLDYNQLRKKK
jgi:hypothetical protein